MAPWGEEIGTVGLFVVTQGLVDIERNKRAVRWNYTANCALRKITKRLLSAAFNPNFGESQ
jgi:hypothetical protein